VIASVFADIVFTFGKYNKGILLRPAFTNIFNSENGYKLIINRLPEILIHLTYDKFSKVSGEDEEQEQEDRKFTEAVMQRIKDLWTIKEKGPWREFASFIEIIPRLPYCHLITSYNTHYLENIWNSFSNSNNEIRTVSIKSLCKLLICNSSSIARKDMIGKIMKLGSASSFYERRYFFVFCIAAIETFAFSLIENIGLLKAYLQLSVDPVANIRLCFVKYATKMWSQGINEIFRKDLMEALNMLKTDKNTEVRNMAVKAYNFLTEHHDEIVKGDVLRKKKNESKEEQEEALKQKQEEEKTPSPSPIHHKLERKNTACIMYKGGQKRQVMKKLSGTIMTIPKSTLKDGKKTSCGRKESNTKVHTVEDSKSALKSRSKMTSPKNSKRGKKVIKKKES